MKLKHRIELQQKETTQDSSGQMSTAWSAYRTCSALVNDVTAKERLVDQRQAGIVTTKVYLRYPRGGRFPTPNDRVVYRPTTTRTRYLNIDGVIDRDNHEYLTLMCLESGE